MEVDANRSDRPIGNFMAPGRDGRDPRADGAGKRNRLLVPLDGSRLAEMALPHAARLAQATSSELTLLQVVMPFVLYDPMGTGVVPSPAAWDAWEEEPARAREYLRSIADVLSQQGLSAATIVLEGEAYFTAAFEAMRRARRSITLLGWGFDPRTRLFPDGRGDAGEPDEVGRPWIRSLLDPAREDMPAISIAHADGVAVALAAIDPRARLGIAIESVVEQPEPAETESQDPGEVVLIEAIVDSDPARQEWKARLRAA